MASASEGPKVDIARQALLQAREDARRRTSREPSAVRRRPRQSARPAVGLPPPASLRTVIADLFQEHVRQLHHPTVQEQEWESLVGPDIARHAQPDGYHPSTRTLVIRTDSLAWAAQLRLMSGRLLASLNERLGPGTVRTLRIVAPHSSSADSGR
jgi:predicted nucleic acid-binding Zn ribbon protein